MLCPTFPLRIYLMDKNEIRRRQLLKLIDQYGDGFKTRFARRVKMHPSAIAHFLYSPDSGHFRPITEKTVAYIEKELDLPTGWFDSPITAASLTVPWPFKHITHQQFLLLSDADQEDIDLLLKIKFDRYKKLKGRKIP